MSHSTTPRTQTLPEPVPAATHTSISAPIHYEPNWPFPVGATTQEIEGVTCRACLEAIQAELDITCHHQLSRNTRFEPGEYCDLIALPTAEYCFQHAADHGEHDALVQWDEAI